MTESGESLLDTCIPLWVLFLLCAIPGLLALIAFLCLNAQGYKRIWMGSLIFRWSVSWNNECKFLTYGGDDGTGKIGEGNKPGGSKVGSNG